MCIDKEDQLINLEKALLNKHIKDLEASYQGKEEPSDYTLNVRDSLEYDYEDDKF